MLSLERDQFEDLDEDGLLDLCKQLGLSHASAHTRTQLCMILLNDAL